jgi:hypothetical protein
MGYMEAMLKIDNSDELEEEDKLDCVRDVIKTRLGIDLPVGSGIVKQISDRLGSTWTDSPAPVAFDDIPEQIIYFYKQLVAA